MRSTKSKIFYTSLALLVGFLALPGGSYLLRAYQSPISQIGAYTLVQSDSSIAVPAATTIRSRTLVTAVRSDGASVKAVLGAIDKSSSVYDSRRIVLPAAGRDMTVSDKIGAVSTQYFKAQTQPSSPFQGAANCQRKTATPMKFLGSEQLVGYQTYKYEQTYPFENGKSIDTTFWYAPALHCSAIKTVSILSQGGTAIERNEVIPVSITVGEPDGPLFQVATNYRDLPPSARQTEAAAQNGVTSTPANAKLSMQTLDDRYYKSRNAQP